MKRLVRVIELVTFIPVWMLLLLFPQRNGEPSLSEEHLCRTFPLKK